MSTTKAHPHPIIQIHFKCIQFISNKHRWSLRIHFNTANSYSTVSNMVFCQNIVMELCCGLCCQSCRNVTKWHEHSYARNAKCDFAFCMMSKNWYSFYCIFLNFFPVSFNHAIENYGLRRFRAKVEFVEGQNKEIQRNNWPPINRHTQSYIRICDANSVFMIFLAPF